MAAAKTDGPRTRAERTGFGETSTHADVIAFLDGLSSPWLHRTSFGRSPEGRDLPLLVLSTKGVKTPADARRARLPVVLVINGIHAGEVEGKEACLALVRDLLAGEHPGVLERVTLVVVPLFNPDGNDRMDEKNRPLDLAKRTGQDGPPKVGTRTTAAGINLNRDYLLQAAPEMRALHRDVWLRWLPDLTLDTHSTNGSVHRFDLTYDVPHTVESGAPGPIAFMRDVFAPELTRRVRTHGRETFFYGNFVEDEGGQGEGWMTYTHHPRFGSNFRGLTGRCDLLLESFSYLPFPDRIHTTYHVLLEALRLAGERGEVLREVVAAAWPPARVAVRYTLEAAAAPATILTRTPRTLTGAPTEVTIPHLSRFTGTRVVDRPWAYAVPEPVAERLAGLGLAVHRLQEACPARLERATVEAVRETDARAILEAPGEALLDVSWAIHQDTLAANTWLVETGQPLGAIACYLCEPESDDGLIPNGLCAKPARGTVWPVARILEPVREVP